MPLDDVAGLVDHALRADATIHTAFPTHFGDWFAAVEVERTVVAALAVALKGSGKRLIVSNGTGFYGDAGGRYLDESTPVPASPIAVRASATRSATTTEGLHGIEVRLASFVHGAGGSVFVPILMEAARRSGRSVYVGEGANRLSAVHVDGAADAFLAALDHGRPGAIYHVASDDAPTMRELALAVAVGANATAVSVSAEAAAVALGDFPALFVALDNGLSSRRARCELGWSPAGTPSLLWDVAHGSYSDSGLLRSRR